MWFGNKALTYQRSMWAQMALECPDMVISFLAVEMEVTWFCSGLLPAPTPSLGTRDANSREKLVRTGPPGAWEDL